MQRPDSLFPFSARRVAAGLSVVALALGGCATAPYNADCADADWFARGVDDGTRGLAMTELNRYHEACAADEDSPDVRAYQQGRYEGLQQFCTVANGLSAGETGAAYAGVCPTALEYYFVTGYRMGREIHHLRASIQQNRDVVVRAQGDADDSANGATGVTKLERDNARMQARLDYLEAEGERITAERLSVASSDD